MNRFSPLALFRLGAAAALALALACGGGDLMLPSSGQPAAIAVVTGASQSGVAGGILPESLAVKVTDATNRPVVQIRVAFTVDAGGGRSQPDTAVTDNTGRAAAQWVLGAQAGTHTTRANVVGSTQLVASFTATVSAGTPGKFQLVSGDAQTALAGSALASPLVVKATDAQGNPVAGIVVAWSVTGGGSVSPAISTTGADGTTSTQRTLGPTAGPQSTTANAGNVPGSPVTFSATATTGSAGQLSITTQPSTSAVIGQLLKTQPQVQLRDNGGNPVAQAGVAVIARIASGPAGGALSGQLTQATNANGLATFVDLAISGTTGTFMLGFSGAPGANLAGVTSTPIAVNSGLPSALLSTVVAAPTSVAIGAASTITVTVRDILGNPMGGINVVPAADDPSGTFTPPQATTGSNGVATVSFTGTKARTYRISALAGTVAIAQTASVQVTKPPTVTAIVSDNPDPSIVGQPITVIFTVTATTGTPAGNVTVSDGQASCSASVATGQCQLMPQTAGSRTLTATYGGSDTFAPSSGTASHQVTLAPTTTQLSSSRNPAPQGQSVTFTAQVASTFQTPAAGTVLFGDGGNCPAPADTLGTKSVNSSGVATLSKKNLTVGTHSLIACYLGTATYSPSASPVLLQQIISTK